MHYKLLYEWVDEPLLTRLFGARQIEDLPEDFFNPSFSRYWQSEALLNDIDKALTRIQEAISNNEKIMIFGDYDVDGVSSSYIMYTFFKKFLHYDHISIRLPHRLHDGYGIKSYHLDEIHAKGVSLVITVDNGITAVQEALHAKELWIDFIITDHHRQLETIPEWYAVINPQVSAEMEFKDICGAMVAFKVIRWLAKQLIPDQEQQKKVFQYYLPIVAIATVADCMPLIKENRLVVTEWLARINAGKAPSSLRNFLEYLNIKWPIDTQHIGFQIAPRLNAGWRMKTPYDSLYTLLHTWEKQLDYLEKLDAMNTDRKKIQDKIVKEAEESIDLDSHIVFIGGHGYHEWVIGIVAWRMCDKHHKPTIVYSINPENWLAVASLRGPDYSSVIDLLYSCHERLERFGGHKHAWWMTFKLDHLDEIQKAMNEYAYEQRWEIEKKKTIIVDTHLHAHEYTSENLWLIEKLAPFGEGNREPLFLIPHATVTKIEKVGKNGTGHMKLRLVYQDAPITALFWWEWSSCEEISPGQSISLIWSLKKDDFNGWVYIRGEAWALD
jgi:single-stranded-DNA-specific exonuclease